MANENLTPDNRVTVANKRNDIPGGRQNQLRTSRPETPRQETPGLGSVSPQPAPKFALFTPTETVPNHPSCYLYSLRPGQDALQMHHEQETENQETRTREVEPLRRDQEMVQNIAQNIDSTLPGRIDNLKVDYENGCVILRGECHSYYHKQLAQHAALSELDGLKLENQIQVRSR